jgi:radical SAM family uncharacterized protein
MLSAQTLIEVRRPGRYVGSEWNAVRKDFSKIKLSFCLCFPEVYEIGMSHLGIRILYDVLNSKKEYLCERAFCPWPDYKQALQKNSAKLSSLESDVPLAEFDILGFSVNNELNYTNILSMLSLGGIPLMSRDRENKYPLIIGGGNCTLNPEPIADFFDLFVIGEAEEVILKIADVCKKFKKKYGNIYVKKEELLLELCQLPGVYVPQFYHVEYNSDSSVKEFYPMKKEAPVVIRKTYVEDLNKIVKASNWIVPNIEIVHDRIGIEIMRGCVNRCRFCQARSYSYPLRIRSPKKILDLAKKLYKLSGYEQISLLSLSSSDHPRLADIVKVLMKYFSSKSVSISLPSIRAKSVVGDISRLLSLQKKTGLTFAPEAGTEKLRKIIDKNINIDELFQVTADAYRAGYRNIKLYFMIGLPKEEYEDLDGIIDLSYRLSKIRKDLCGQSAEINVSVSTLIPKPHTSLQWLGMVRTDELLKRQEYLKRSISKDKQKIRLNFHNIYMSKVEAALCRGNRNLAKVILAAFTNGAQFDQWEEYFNFNNWLNSFAKNGIDIEEYTASQLDIEKPLIWDFIDTGIKKQSLIEEFKKALT